MSSGSQRLKVSSGLVLLLFFLRDSQELYLPLGLLDDSCDGDVLHLFLDAEQSLECVDPLRVEGVGLFPSPCQGWSVLLLWCPVTDYLLNYRRESCRGATARGPHHLTSSSPSGWHTHVLFAWQPVVCYVREALPHLLTGEVKSALFIRVWEKDVTMHRRWHSSEHFSDMSGCLARLQIMIITRVYFITFPCLVGRCGDQASPGLFTLPE